MTDKNKRIEISSSTNEAKAFYQTNVTKGMPPTAVPNQDNSTPSSFDTARRSPVTDLLFDRPRVGDKNSDTNKPTERKRPVYHISIVAEMVETHPQTLRMYERMGLLNPQRTRHNVRLYSEDDVDQVRRIQHLTQDLGVNLAGVEVVFKLLREMRQLREELEQEIDETLRQQNQD